MSQTQTQTTERREVEPNARYDAVFGTNYAGLDPDSDRMEELREDTRGEAAVLRDAEEEVEEYDLDEEETDTLTWEHVSVTEEPQLLASICSFYSGVSAGEEVPEIRRKLRSGDVEWYVNTFLVVRGILGDEGGGSHV